ncbi:hypothetical protein GINT2_000542 [Glugoides intestinalis]
MEEEYFGKITRYLIENQNRNRATPKDELRIFLDVPTKNIDRLLAGTQEFLSFIGLEIVGLLQNTLVPFSESKKLFLRRVYSEGAEESPVEVDLNDKRLFITFSAIQFENNKLASKHIDTLQQCPCFKGIKAADFFEDCKQKGYIVNKKENDESYWSLSWRFYVEFGDSFDVTEYFRDYQHLKQ